MKAKLLAENEQTLVVSAISGLGGLGKSVLAVALVLDPEVQKRFSDGILWVTLGQNPDLQTMLGDWIRELDKSRDAFSANTLEAASRYLHNLLVERRMLLVVDDVWNAAHAEWFRVRGLGCRVLVTTREAQIEGAEVYALDLMSEDEAVVLVREKVGQNWNIEQEEEVKAFAKVLGFLPLALDLAANQVQEGLTWKELRSEFEAERRAVALELLDSSEAWDQLNEEEQRKYSLRACFQLSLKRLKPEQLRQFAWLGVLPEDVNLSVQVAAMLWNLNPIKAKKGLIDLRRRSFLTDGITTTDGAQNYRVHDLMHDMARNLIVDDVLADDLAVCELDTNHSNFLELAHRKFLERYRKCALNSDWAELPNDGYIHRHLTWHMEQANWMDEIHELLSSSNNQGRNAWFEVCDRIGQPAIFVEDVVRAWAIAESEYAQQPTKSIVLQCRYALITSTLNHLVGNLPISMMEEFVKGSFWTIEQAFAYVEQMKDERKITEAIKTFASYLSKSMFSQVFKMTQTIDSEVRYTEVLCALAGNKSANLVQLSEASTKIKDSSRRAIVLRELSKIDPIYLPDAVKVAKIIKDLNGRSAILRQLTEISLTCSEEALNAAKEITNKEYRASALRELAQINSNYFAEALKAAKEIENPRSRAFALEQLEEVKSASSKLEDDTKAKELLSTTSVQSDRSENLNPSFFSKNQLQTFPKGTDLKKTLLMAQSIKSEKSRAFTFLKLANTEAIYLLNALSQISSFQNYETRAYILCGLAKIDTVNLSDLCEMVKTIPDRYTRTQVLCEFAQIEKSYFTNALTEAQHIEDNDKRIKILCQLAKIKGADFTQLLSVTLSIQDGYILGNLLIDLATIDRSYLDRALYIIDWLEDNIKRSQLLNRIAQIQTTDLSISIRLVNSIEDEGKRADIFCTLINAKLIEPNQIIKELDSIKLEDNLLKIFLSLIKNYPSIIYQLFNSAHLLNDDFIRSRFLISIAQTDPYITHQVFKLMSLILDEEIRLKGFKDLLKIGFSNSSELLQEFKFFQSERIRLEFICSLAQFNIVPLSEPFRLMNSLTNDDVRAEILFNLIQIDNVDFNLLLAATNSIQDDIRRAEVLCALTKISNADFDKLLMAASLILDEFMLTELLCALTKTNNADFDKLLMTASRIKSKNKYTKVLCSLCYVDNANLDKLLTHAHLFRGEYDVTTMLYKLENAEESEFKILFEKTNSLNKYNFALLFCTLVKQDKRFLSDALDFLGSLIDEEQRAELLYRLIELVDIDHSGILRETARIQSIYWVAKLLNRLTKNKKLTSSQILEAAASIQDKQSYAQVVSDLAKIDPFYFGAALNAIQAVKDEANRARLLVSLAREIPNSMLSEIFSLLKAFTDKSIRAKVISAFLPRISPSEIDYTDWKHYLHQLSNRERDNLMKDFASLKLIIYHFGDKAAMPGVVDAMCNVASQWK